MPSHTTQIKVLYARLPKIACKGLCAHSCTPVYASPLEKHRMAEAGGEPVANGDDCAYLVEGRCSVYEVRPMICRLWGVDSTMPCPHGCEIDGEPLSMAEGDDFLSESQKIGGGCIPIEEATMDEYYDRTEAILARRGES